MCGRYAASSSLAELVEVFGIEEVVEAEGLPALAPRYNIAPTDPVPAVVERRGPDGRVVRKLVRPRWGLVPSWAKERGVGARMINARSETVDVKPSYRKAFTSRRCLLPADGYYEWYTLQQPAPPAGGRPPKPVKQPFWIHPLERPGEPSMMVMAGLYEFWRDPELPEGHPDAWLTTCTVITTTATDALGQIHDRMPMQVRRQDWDDWLDPGLTDPAAVRELMHAPGAQEMSAWAVSRLVNSVRNDGPELVLPLPEARAGAQLPLL